MTYYPFAGAFLITTPEDFMKEFKVIYKILNLLRALMGKDFDSSLFSPEFFDVNKEKFDAIIEMLSDSGYITGVTIMRVDGETSPMVGIDRMRITLKGLEYLEENSVMKKLTRTAKGIKEIIG